jgi:atlastin
MFQVYIISIGGAFRKGKSFILNFFVTYLEWLAGGAEGAWIDENTTLDKFHFQGGKERVTNGICLWGKPYIWRYTNGEEVGRFTDKLITELSGSSPPNGHSRDV